MISSIYHQESINILSDEEYQEKIVDDPFPELEKRFNRHLRSTPEAYVIFIEE